MRFRGKESADAAGGKLRRAPFKGTEDDRPGSDDPKDDRPGSDDPKDDRPKSGDSQDN